VLGWHGAVLRLLVRLEQLRRRVPREPRYTRQPLQQIPRRIAQRLPGAAEAKQQRG